MRVEANVSLRPRGTEAFGTRVEVKNMNSFRSVERAIAYEIERQGARARRGRAARRWRPAAGTTAARRPTGCGPRRRPRTTATSRSPDLPPLHVEPAWIAGIRDGPAGAAGGAASPVRGARDHRLRRGRDRRRPDDDRRVRGDLAARARRLPAKEVANFVTGSHARALKAAARQRRRGPPARRRPRASRRSSRRSSRAGSRARSGRDLLDRHLADGTPADELLAGAGPGPIADDASLLAHVDAVIAANPKAVADYGAGQARHRVLRRPGHEGDGRCGRRRPGHAARPRAPGGWWLTDGDPGPGADRRRRRADRRGRAPLRATRTGATWRCESRTRTSPATRRGAAASRPDSQDRRVGRDGRPAPTGPGGRRASRSPGSCSWSPGSSSGSRRPDRGADRSGRRATRRALSAPTSARRADPVAGRPAYVAASPLSTRRAVRPATRASLDALVGAPGAQTSGRGQASGDADGKGRSPGDGSGSGGGAPREPWARVGQPARSARRVGGRQGRLGLRPVCRVGERAPPRGRLGAQDLAALHGRDDVAARPATPPGTRR